MLDNVPIPRAPRYFAVFATAGYLWLEVQAEYQSSATGSSRLTPTLLALQLLLPHYDRNRRGRKKGSSCAAVRPCNCRPGSVVRPQFVCQAL